MIGKFTEKAYASRGFEFLIKGILDEAFLDFNTSIKLAPTYAIAYFGRFVCHLCHLW